MGNMIVILLLLLFVGMAISKIKKNKENGNGCLGCSQAGSCPNFQGDASQINQGEIGKAIKIRFDLRDVKIYRLIFLVSFLLFASGFLLLFLELAGSEIFILFALYMGGGVSLFSGLYWFCAALYVRRLVWYGYKAVYDKREYEGVLSNLPREGENTSYPNFSKIFWYITLACFAMAIIWDFGFLFSWDFRDLVMSSAMLLVFSDIIWIIVTIFGAKQRNSKKYRDDLELCNSKKQRMTPEEGVILLLIVIGISLVSKHTISSMVTYIFRSHEQMDQNTICDIYEALDMSIEELKEAGTLDECEGSLQSLSRGTDITDWGVPGDDLQQKVAKKLSVESFSELDQKFRVADGNPVVWCKLSDDGISVCLQNPYRKVRSEIVATGKKGERPVIR